MGTKSRISIENEDGSIDSIYCHYDGYVGWNGFILATYYNDPQKLRQLIELGDVACLDIDIHPKTFRHSFKSKDEGVVLAYHRDAGEKFSKDRYENIDEYKLIVPTADEEFGYLMDKNGVFWVHSQKGRNAKFTDLCELLKELPKDEIYYIGNKEEKILRLEEELESKKKELEELKTRYKNIKDNYSNTSSVFESENQIIARRRR